MEKKIKQRLVKMYYIHIKKKKNSVFQRGQKKKEITKTKRGTMLQIFNDMSFEREKFVCRYVLVVYTRN